MRGPSSKPFLGLRSSSSGRLKQSYIGRANAVQQQTTKAQSVPLQAVSGAFRQNRSVGKRR
eukprot:14795436-Alexandrium_andersonii.AAC.1